MDRVQAIAKVNAHLGYDVLKYRSNTYFANISSNRKPQPHWWLTIPTARFKHDLHILLVPENGSGLIWLRVKAKTITNPVQTFSKRSDKPAISLHIASSDMRDIRNGGTGYDFKPHIEREWDL